MGDNREKTVVSGPPESPVALLDKLRKSLEAPAARSHQSVSRFVLGRLKASGITTEAIAAVIRISGAAYAACCDGRVLRILSARHRLKAGVRWAVSKAFWRRCTKNFLAR